MTDGELVRRVVAGETATYEELVRRWFLRILAFCRSRVFSSHSQDAEDLAQDVLLRAFTNLASLSEPEQFGAWLRGIAINACADWARDRFRQRRALGQQEWGIDLAAMTISDAGSPADDESEIVLRQIATIPEDLREVILLRYYDDLTYDEMAQWLGVARATVNERLAKARALLRVRLAKLRSDV